MINVQQLRLIPWIVRRNRVTYKFEVELSVVLDLLTVVSKEHFLWASVIQPYGIRQILFWTGPKSRRSRCGW